MRRIAPAIIILALFVGMLSFLLYWPVPVQTEQPAAPVHPEAAPAPHIPGAVVLIDCIAVQIAADAVDTDAAKPLLELLNPDQTISGVLAADDVAAAHAHIQSLVDAGHAHVLVRPRIMVLSGEPARVAVQSLKVAGTSGHHSLEIPVTPLARQDGSISLVTGFTRKQLEGEISVFLDDLGLPTPGRRSAHADLTLPRGWQGYLVRGLRDGSLLVLILSPSVPADSHPAPAADPDPVPAESQPPL